MILHTASEGITLSKKLETDSAKFYEHLAGKFEGQAELFRAFAKANNQFIVQIERAYYGVITDALEGSYAFTTLDSDHYAIKTEIEPGMNLSSARDRAINIEQIICKFYDDAAEQSKGLMADVPRLFSIVAKKRQQRIASLQSVK